MDRESTTEELFACYSRGELDGPTRLLLARRLQEEPEGELARLIREVEAATANALNIDWIALAVSLAEAHEESENISANGQGERRDGPE